MSFLLDLLFGTLQGVLTDLLITILGAPVSIVIELLTNALTGGG